MKQSILSLLLSLLNLFFIGWVLIALYDAYAQFALIIKEDSNLPWEISFSIWPFFFIILYSICIYLLYKRQKKKNKEKTSFWLFPFQFSEEDERERALSAEACRKAFISTWISAPLAAITLVFYPLFQDKFHYFPILLILLIPAIQVITYFFHIKKVY